MTTALKNVYTNKLDIQLIKTAIHSAIKMKPVDVESSTYINKKNNKEDPKFKVGDDARYQNIKSVLPNQSEKVFVITKVKNTVPWTYVISETGDEKKLRKRNQKEYRIEKIIQRR